MNPISALGDGNPFSQDVVNAVPEHMNVDHRDDSVTIIAAHGARPDATSAVMVDLGGTGAVFDVESPLGPDRVRGPWAPTIVTVWPASTVIASGVARRLTRYRSEVVAISCAPVGARPLDALATNGPR